MACSMDIVDRVDIAAGRVENVSRLMSVVAESLGAGCDEGGAALVACDHLQSICEDMKRIRDDLRTSA